MSITGPGSITAANIQAVNNMTKQLDTLTAELGSGQAAQTYSGLGSQAGLTLALNGQLSAINAYSNTATTVGTTLGVAQSVLSQLDGSRNTVEQAIGQQGAFSLNGNGQTSTQAAAVSQLGEILSLLNTQVGNNYIFSGSATTTPSVASSDAILNGNGAQAGLVQVINERLQADRRHRLRPPGGRRSGFERVARRRFRNIAVRLQGFEHHLEFDRRHRHLQFATVARGQSRRKSQRRRYDRVRPDAARRLEPDHHAASDHGLRRRARTSSPSAPRQCDRGQSANRAVGRDIEPGADGLAGGLRDRRGR